MQRHRKEGITSAFDRDQARLGGRGYSGCMKKDNLQVEIGLRIVELCAAYPRISHCSARMEDWRDGGNPRYALGLDIRWPQHQSLVSGPACASAEGAVEAAFAKTMDSLTAHA